MMYAKFINKEKIEMAPRNKGSVSNYNLDEKLMKRDGYKPVILSECPIDGNEYVEVYELVGDEILQIWELEPVDLETLRQKKLREFYEFDIVYRKTATVEYECKKFSISQDAKINLMAVVTNAQFFGTYITYFEKNGNYADYTLAEFLPIAEVISQEIAKAETSYYEKEAEILNAQTQAELEEIIWQK